jgi:L-alanine-DL-glutamate epimerase-like enolase superfamily enzyme
MKRTIRAIDVLPLELELNQPFSISGGESRSVEIAVVRIELADGTTGLGEAAPFPPYDGQTRESVLEALSTAAPSLIGLDPLLSHQIHQCARDAAPGSASALVALEMAALDAMSRAEQVPLWRCSGAANAGLVSDLTIVAGDLDHAARSARLAREAGFRTLKVKVGRDGLDLDQQRLQVISSAAPDCDLLLDANGGFTGEEAHQLILFAQAHQIPVVLLEQPVPPEDEESMAMLTALKLVPICADESCRSAADAMRIAENQLADAINIKTQKSGYLESIRIHQVASSARLSLMIGGMVESVLSMSFSAHLARGLGGFRWVDLDTPLFIRDHPFIGGIEFEGGSVCFDDLRFGHGVELGPTDSHWCTLAEEDS